MSDYFEMHEQHDKLTLAAEMERNLNGWLYAAIIACMLGATLGMEAAIRDLLKPVGSVSQDHCVNKPCKMYIYLKTKE